jgi:hypothetical protein
MVGIIPRINKSIRIKNDPIKSAAAVRSAGLKGLPVMAMCSALACDMGKGDPE